MEKAISIIMSYLDSTWGVLLQAKSQLSTTNAILMLSMLGMMLYRAWAGGAKPPKVTRKLTVVSEDDFPPIEPLDKFGWETTEPLQLRPYKPKYNLTMALENLEPSELIPIDKEYKDRIYERRKVLKENYDIALGIHSDKGTVHRDGEEAPLVHDAICELYEYVMGIYLPNRYPTMFTLMDAKFETGKVFMLQNKVTGEVLPASVSPGGSLIKALETLAKTIDEDMLILLPSENGEKLIKEGDDGLRDRRKGEKKESLKTSVSDKGNTKYVLQAYATCFPSGFNTREKLGKQLAAIHDPVPGYKEKLEKSMDRYFERLEVGKYMKRMNWTVTAGAELFSAFGDIHSSKNEDLRPLKSEELDLDDTFLRVERQTLYRLPKSGAIVFSIHTYRYPIQQIKEEGSGEDLAAAIDGIETGNIPHMGKYKRVPVWGQAVKDYLRS
ncbi:uncharacterized protein GIQ15_03147 [Arthroderma uncinatum]|uniref:uncharacterized protein n=1 Tax=Arthroderma uncinatum TaxID=74035 RepID=UPI00144AF9EE|nr:uncharacterized protein GIQ15_03147 [Arthroderma uncinatum]KAF3483823.1 hypothetical protein GIQ15_03147 [Arthroderma uncinatum]